MDLASPGRPFTIFKKEKKMENMATFPKKMTKN